ncbi:MAG: calcineurin-like phosphoesterase family protein, partial [Acetobacteraceae bacterium]|nr:calcineurin-like phosphoesterase family protein [Acetobacteraceae bacterium]
DARGVPGVMVSNGRDVVKTDAEGRWSLPVQAGDALFVIKPTGFATPLDPAMRLPRFSYLHDPEGTPASLDLRFAGVAPTGTLPDSIDFPLRRQPEAASFKALLFTDPQPESLAEVGYIRDDVVAQTAGIDAAFGITHGDVMFDDLSFYDRYNRIVGAVGLPWYNCSGNHDMNLEVPDNTHSRETFKRVFGARHYAFQYGGTTFILLDNVEYLGTDPAKPNGYGKYQGRFGPRQLAFVRNVLANVPQESLVVVCHHIPLKTQQGTEPNTANTDTRDFLEAISTHPNTVSFSGHTHTNEHWYFGADDGFAGGTHHHHVLAAVSGSWWSGPFDERGIPVALESDGSPNGFHILEVDGARYTTTLVPARDPARPQMRIMLDSQIHQANPEVMKEYRAGALLTGPIARSAAASTRVVVNLFDGGPRSSVSMTVGPDGAAAPMRRVTRRDPFVDEVYARNADTKKPWVSSAASTHVWQAALPAGLQAGAHRITVRATDEYGREHTAWMILEVTA